MIDPLGMMGSFFGTSNIFGDSMKTPEGNSQQSLIQPFGDILELGAAPENMQSFSSQMLFVEVSIQVSMRTETAVPADGATSSLDFSPEATATRIFDFSMSLFGVFQSQNSDLSPEEALADFETLVRDAIDEGFAQATDILEGMGAMNENVSAFIDETSLILTELLDNFFADADPLQLLEQQPLIELGDSAEVFTASLEMHYQSIYLEASSGGGNGNGYGILENALSNPGKALGLENALANTSGGNYLQFHAESLSIALSYSQGSAQDPSLQLFA